MVFAIRRLLLRSRIPNATLRVSTQLQLRHTFSPNASTQLLRTPSCLHQRAFSVQTRLGDEGKNGKRVKDEDTFEKELEKRAEEASKSEFGDVKASGKKHLATGTEKDVKASNKGELVQDEKDSAVFEDVELPTKDDTVPKPPTNLPTNDDPIAAKEETAVFEDVELPTKDKLVPEPPTNLPTNDDPISATEERSIEKPASSGDIEQSRMDEVIARLGKAKFNVEETEDDFELTTEGEATIKAWIQDIGISDEKLAYFVETYPGIDAPLIEAVHKGKIPEESLLDVLEELHEAEEADLPPEAQEKLKSLTKHYNDFGKDLFDDNPNFAEAELKQLGLRKSDIAALRDDTAELTEAQTIRIGKAMRKVGLSHEEFDAVMDVDESELREMKEQEKEDAALDQTEKPELEGQSSQIDVFTKVMEEIEDLQSRTGLSDEKVMHYISKFNGQITANLIEAAENKKVTEERLEYYIEKYGVTYPLPVDASLIIAMDKGEIEEKALDHIVESMSSPPPDLIKAIFKGETTIEEVNNLCEKYGVPTHIIGSIHKGEITEENVQNFVAEYPGVEPDVQLINDINKGIYSKEHLGNLKDLGEVYPNIMSAEYWRGVLAGDITQKDLDQAEKAAETGDPWDVPEDAMKEWKQEYGISDKMLEFLRDTYPGIWPDLVTSYAKGEIKESEIPRYINSEEPWQMPKGMIDRWLEAREIPEARMIELREKFPKIWPDLVADVVSGEVKEEDVERIIEEEEADEEKGDNEWLRAGVTEENIHEWLEENGITGEMLQYLTKTYPNIPPDVVLDFAEGVIEQKNIPQAIKDYYKGTGKEQKGVQEEEEREKGEVQHKKPKQLEIPSQVEGKTMAERVEWYESRYPGIDIETIALAEMGLITEASIPEVMRNVPGTNSDQDYMRAELLKESPANLQKMGRAFKEDLDEQITDGKEESPMEKARKITDGPLTKLLPTNGGKISDIENMGMDDFYQMLLAEGIDPNKMNEKEIFKMMDEKFAPKDYEYTNEDGDTIRYFAPKSPEELKKIEAGMGNPMEPIIFDPPGMGDREWANELKDGDSAQEEAEIEQGLDEMFGALSKDEIEEAKKERVEEGFFNYGEDNPKDVGEDEEFQGDDISSQGHEELEQHRELREYARLAAWELPLLHKLAKPFEPPKQNQPLRFRYTTYFGAQHPADKKVVVQFAPSEIPDLTDMQRMKMIKLAGVRYNPDSGLIKMASESMETQAQNKRYLGDLITKLIKESKDPKDTFEDVPVDFRHHTPKPFHKLPERWKLTPERKTQLEEKRRKVLEEERTKKDTGKLIDGVGVIEQAMKRLGMAQLQEKKNAMAGAKVAVPAARRGAAVRGKVGQPLPGRK